MKIRFKRVSTPGKLSERYEKILDYLDKECFSLDDLYPKDDCWWWVGFNEEDLPVCFCGMKEVEGEDNEGLGFLCRAGVLPSYRRNGLQTRMIRLRIKEAKKHFETLITYTDSFNIVSSNNLIKRGFRLYTPQTNWGGENCLYWWLSIKANPSDSNQCSQSNEHTPP